MSATLRSDSPKDDDRGGSSIAHLLLRAAQRFPAGGIHLAPRDLSQSTSEFVSYPMLLDSAMRILSGLRMQLKQPGARIVLLLERPVDFIPAFWASVLGGYVPCPVAPIRNDPMRWEKHLAHVDELLGRPLIVSSGELFEDLPASATAIHLDVLRKAQRAELIHEAAFNDTAILMLTSGSTGNSKAVELTHANLLASLAARAERQEIGGADVMFNWIAFDHVAALLESHMIAAYAGAAQLHAEPGPILAAPLHFLELIHTHRVTVAFAPNFLIGQINAALQVTKRSTSESAPLTLDLSCLRRIVTGGEANVVETGRRFLDLLAPYGLSRRTLWPAFGMTETCAACVYSHEFPECDTDREFAAVGLPLRGLQVRIVGESGDLLDDASTGELQLRGPMIFGRYYNNEEATRAAFTHDGWFRTGDLGRIEEGRLRLVARTKDSIIVSGVNYFSHELEAQLESLDGVDRSFVAAFPTRPRGADTEQLIVAFATSIPFDDEERLYQLAVAVRNTTIMLWGFRPAALLPLPQDKFPKTSLGKIQRSLMRKRFEAGEYGDVVVLMAQMTSRQLGPHVQPESGLESDVAAIFSDVLRIPAENLSATASFFDLGGTSLDILALTLTLERRLGFKAGLPTVLMYPTVRQLAQHIAVGSQSVQEPYDPIVPLQRSGRKTPLFCVHPGNGEILVLINLAKYFVNDRPFHALRPRGFNAGESRFASVDEVVQSYLEAILRRQPRGPYAIAGYSLGCRIAFEIVKELEARGEAVAFFGCIDFFPGFESTPVSFATIATGLAFVTDLIDKSRRDILIQTLNEKPIGGDVCAHILQFAAPERLAELRLDLQKFSAWARVAHAMEDLLLTHISQGKVTSTTVLRSTGVEYYGDWPTLKWHEQLRRWEQLSDRIRYVDLPGHHHTLMSTKYVAATQALLRAEIDRAFVEYHTVATSPESDREPIDPLRGTAEKR